MVSRWVLLVILQNKLNDLVWGQFLFTSVIALPREGELLSENKVQFTEYSGLYRSEPVFSYAAISLDFKDLQKDTVICLGISFLQANEKLQETEYRQDKLLGWCSNNRSANDLRIPRIEGKLETITSVHSTGSIRATVFRSYAITTVSYLSASSYLTFYFETIPHSQTFMFLSWWNNNNSAIQMCGYISASGACSSCSDKHCIACFLDYQCSGCKSGFYLKDNACNPCARGCMLCSSHYNCSQTDYLDKIELKCGKNTCKQELISTINRP